MSKPRLNELQKAVKAALVALRLPPATTAPSAGAGTGELSALKRPGEGNIAGRAEVLGFGLLVLLGDIVSRAELSLPVALGKENVCGK